MDDLMKVNDDIVLLNENLLVDARNSINNKKTITIPMTELSTLGTGVSSMIPAFHTVTQTTSLATDGLYKIANAAVGDTLKMAKNGNAWGAMKTAAGGSKMVQLAQASPISMTTQTVSAFNPATIMMAATLYSIEKELKSISETQKQILSFLEIEKESTIEADVETLSELVQNFKYNWNNDVYVANSHKLVMDIKRKARSHMISYQKSLDEFLAQNQVIVAQNKVQSILANMEKKFKYYRLALYTFSLASLLEIMLGGNYTEEYIEGIKNEISKMSDIYCDFYQKGDEFLKKLEKKSIEINVMKGVSAAGKAVGQLMEHIPILKEKAVSQSLIDSGDQIKNNVSEIEKKAVLQYATIRNSGTEIFTNKMDDLIQIYNRTNQICFDKDNIYLINDSDMNEN